VLVPGLLSNTRRLLGETQTLAEIMQERIIKVALGVILVFALFSAMVSPFLGSSETRSLLQYDQEAMKWVSQNTPQNSQFALLSGDVEWFTDPISEWFPALARRISVSTVQGSEWLPDHQIKKQIVRYNQLQSCSEQDTSCILSWAKNNDISFSYLYVSKRNGGDNGISMPAINSMMTSDRLQLAFDNPGVSIFKLAGNP